MGTYPDSETIVLTLAMLSEYLRPPGDSSRFQPPLDNALLRMEEAAIADQTIKSVILQIDPALP